MVAESKEYDPERDGPKQNPGYYEVYGDTGGDFQYVPPVLQTPKPLTTLASNAVKVATPDLIITGDEAVDADIMVDLIFENIGGQEIINIARNDIVNGQNVFYSPIKNLNQIAFNYNPSNILPVSNPSDNFFKNFSIKFSDYIPEIGTGPNGETIYFDPETADLTINVVNVPQDIDVDVRLFSVQELLDDTIY